MKRTNLRLTHCGFSLLEMLVTLVLISAVGGSLYTLMNNQFFQLRHFESVQTTIDQETLLLDWLTGLNPAQNPEGKEVLTSETAAYEIHWNSERLTPPLSEALSGLGVNEQTMGNIGSYQADIYRVQLVLWRNGQPVLRRSWIQSGFIPVVNGKPFRYPEQ